jgi:transcriptional regulator with XRE-family HTH domain
MEEKQGMTIRQAARELRSRLGLSQQAMATRLEASMAAIRNYESGATLKPEAGILQRYGTLAIFTRNADLAEVFEIALGNALGIRQEEWKMLRYLNRATDEERTILAAALATLRGEAAYRRYREPLVNALRKPWQTWLKATGYSVKGIKLQEGMK